MDKNPLEQQKAKIDARREEMRGKLCLLFDEKEKLEERVKIFILQLEILEKAGLVFNKEEIIRGINEGIKIQDRDKFISHLLRALEPLTILRVTQAKIFDKVQRDETINNSGYLRLSEVLYVNFEDENAYIHLAPARDFMTRDKMGDFNLEIQTGLTELAKRIKSDEKVKEIWAISWVVAKSRRRLEEFGFTFVGEISEEERKENVFVDEKRPIAKAFMKREDFLARYGSTTNG